MEKPSQNRRVSTGKSDKKTAARNKQTNPCNANDCLFMQANVGPESDEPSKSRDETAFQRKQ
jgi:hypothetical protein